MIEHFFKDLVGKLMNTLVCHSVALQIRKTELLLARQHWRYLSGRRAFAPMGKREVVRELRMMRRWMSGDILPAHIILGHGSVSASEQEGRTHINQSSSTALHYGQNS